MINYFVEELYNVIEALVITFFVSMYFEKKKRYTKAVYTVVITLLMICLVTIISYLNLHWVLALISSAVLLYGIVTLFYNGSISEHIIISIVGIFLLALADVCGLTMLSSILGIEYNEMVKNSSFFRFLAVLISKTIYLILASIIIFFKNRYHLFIHKRELALMVITMLLSGVQLSLIRNIIYDSKSNYNIFLIILICVFLLNIIQYYSMIYIGKKNADERNISLMQKQMEFQKESIQALEQKYDETAKVRHDIKNYITCALRMAEKKDFEELTKFLEKLSEEKIDSITSYVNLKRSVLGAVLNSKISNAKRKNIDIQCYLLSEFDSISDMDMGILLANLLDNALEACEKNVEKSEIIIKTWAEAGYYFLEISNTVESDILINNPELKTNKDNSDLHGVGLRTVRDIVKKYDGMMSFEQKGCIFHVYVSLEKNCLNM